MLCTICIDQNILSNFNKTINLQRNGAKIRVGELRVRASGCWGELAQWASVKKS